MNLRYLQYFRVLAEEEHVTRAANRLFISQPSLSNAMTALEEELGLPLFEKKGRNISLTKYGKLLAERTDQAFTQLEQTEKFLRAQSDPFCGQIDLAFFGSLGVYFIPTLLKEFLGIPAYQKIQFTFHQGTEQTIHEGLLDGSYDLIFCSARLKKSEALYIPVFSQKMCVVVPEEHPLSKRQSISLKELHNMPFIMLSQKGGLQARILEILGKHQVDVQIQYQCEQGASVAGMVAAGFGISILPRIPLPPLNVHFLEIEEDVPPRIIYLGKSLKHPLSPSAELFQSYLLERYSL
ncbi:LysR family transcriptional regulator [Hominifimenecus sp. rT4P-3]|uniref:LysR family transcriptional regulator n=1 Tax=Hominifimenecus sp. rT4P-3 TaxID=3242979 RepID=UPI003DA42E32